MVLFFIKGEYNHLLFAVLLLLLGSIWWTFFYTSTNNQISVFKKKIFELEKVGKESNDAFYQCDVLKNEIRTLSTEFNQICSCAKQQICEQITLVLECAYRNHVLIKHCTPINTQDGKWFQRISFEILFEGQFLQVAYFLKCLLNSGFIIDCQKCILKKSDNKIQGLGNFNFTQILQEND